MDQSSEQQFSKQSKNYSLIEKQTEKQDWVFKVKLQLQSHTESHRIKQSHKESNRVKQSHKDSQRVLKSHTESYRVKQSHTE